MGKSACVSNLLSMIDKWLAEESLDVSLFDTELAYFRARYYRHGGLDPRFDGLMFRKPDRKKWVGDVIRGAKDDPRDRLLCLLVIVWRLRNNLFHGEKWDGQLQDQRENFINANSVLMRLLDHYGELA